VNKKFIFIVGPTASGKTFISEIISQKLNLPIVSVDSMQIYKEMDIGTAKPDFYSIKKFNYFGIDLVYPSSWFSAGDYYYYIKDLLEDKLKEGALFAGGSGLYYDAIMKGISKVPPKSDAIRNELKDKANKLGLEELFNDLQKVDFDYAKKISKSDEKRILRALEVYYLTGKKFSSFHDNDYFKKKSLNSLFNEEEIIVYGIKVDKDSNDLSIKKRLDLMFDKGFLDEAINIFFKYPDKNKPAFKSIGYFHIFSVIYFLIFAEIFLFILKDSNLINSINYLINSINFLFNSNFKNLSNNIKKIYDRLLLILKNFDFILKNNSEDELIQNFIDQFDFFYCDTYSTDFIYFFYEIGNKIFKLENNKINLNFSFGDFSFKRDFEFETEKFSKKIKEIIQKNDFFWGTIKRRIVFDTIAFSKRQLKWFFKDKEIIWLDKNDILSKFGLSLI
jgi:tRNA dimethylallyltransferase